MSARPTRSPAIIAHSCALVATEGAYVRPVRATQGHRAAWPPTRSVRRRWRVDAGAHWRHAVVRRRRPSPREAALRALPGPRRTTSDGPPDQWHVTVRFSVTWKTTGRSSSPRSAAGAGRRRCDRSAHGPATAWFLAGGFFTPGHRARIGGQGGGTTHRRVGTPRCSRSYAPHLARTRGGAPGPAAWPVHPAGEIRRSPRRALRVDARPQGAFYEARAAVHLPAASTWQPEVAATAHIAERPLGTEVKGRSQGRATAGRYHPCMRRGGF